MATRKRHHHGTNPRNRTAGQRPPIPPAWNTLYQCRHCGGMIVREPVLNTCVLCGRELGHLCDACLVDTP